MPGSPELGIVDAEINKWNMLYIIKKVRLISR